MPCPYLIDGCCDVLREALGWRVGTGGGSVCGPCNAEGGDPRTRKDIERRIKGSLAARILDEGALVWHNHPRKTEDVLADLMRRTNMKPEAARGLIRQAVRRGWDNKKAADVADALGIGDK